LRKLQPNNLAKEFGSARQCHAIWPLFGQTSMEVWPNFGAIRHCSCSMYSVVHYIQLFYSSRATFLT